VTERKPLVDFSDLPSRHGARIGTQRPIENIEPEARAMLAEIMIPAARAARWAKADPEFASLPNDHPMRELARAVERLSRKQSISDLVATAEGATLTPEATRRILDDATPNERERAAIRIVVARRRA
jgi:hypothetical protein